MKKERKRALGYSWIILGLVILFLKPITSITGMAVADTLALTASWLYYAIGLIFMIGGGIMLVASTEEAVEESPPEYENGLVERMHKKDFTKVPPKIEDLNTFRPYKGDIKKAREQARKILRRDYNPFTDAPEYLGADGSIYSFDKSHYDTLMHKKGKDGGNIPAEEMLARMHYDVLDPDLNVRFDKLKPENFTRREVDVHGRILTRAHRK